MGINNFDTSTDVESEWDPPTTDVLLPPPARKRFEQAQRSKRIKKLLYWAGVILPVLTAVGFRVAQKFGYVKSLW